MIKSSRWIPVLLIILFLSMWVGQTSQTNCSAATPQKTHVPALLALNTFSGDKSLPNGIEVYSGKAILQVTALRDDVIRISMGLADDTDAVLAALGEILGEALRQGKLTVKLM